jgi:phosphate transport system permease protein
MARGLGETAPVILTAGYTTGLNTDPFKGPMVSLPLAAFSLVKTGIPTMQARGFAAAALLLAIVVVLFVIARIIGGRGPGQLSKRQARRSQRRSVQDANRFIRRYDQRKQAEDHSAQAPSSPEQVVAA